MMLLLGQHLKHWEETKGLGFPSGHQHLWRVPRAGHWHQCEEVMVMELNHVCVRGEGVSMNANTRGGALSPGMADNEGFQDGNALVRTFSVAKDRNQIQTSVGRERNVLEGLWGQASKDLRTRKRALGWSQDSLFTSDWSRLRHDWQNSSLGRWVLSMWWGTSVEQGTTRQACPMWPGATGQVPLNGGSHDRSTLGWQY